MGSFWTSPDPLGSVLSHRPSDRLKISGRHRQMTEIAVRALPAGTNARVISLSWLIVGAGKTRVM